MPSLVGLTRDELIKLLPSQEEKPFSPETKIVVVPAAGAGDSAPAIQLTVDPPHCAEVYGFGVPRSQTSEIDAAELVMIAPSVSGPDGPKPQAASDPSLVLMVRNSPTWRGNLVPQTKDEIAKCGSFAVTQQIDFAGRHETIASHVTTKDVKEQDHGYPHGTPVLHFTIVDTPEGGNGGPAAQTTHIEVFESRGLAVGIAWSDPQYEHDAGLAFDWIYEAIQNAK